MIGIAAPHRVEGRSGRHGDVTTRRELSVVEVVGRIGSSSTTARISSSSRPAAPPCSWNVAQLSDQACERLTPAALRSLRRREEPGGESSPSVAGRGGT
jgi:hypothetical protein